MAETKRMTADEVFAMTLWPSQARTLKWRSTHRGRFPAAVTLPARGGHDRSAGTRETTRRHWRSGGLRRADDESER
jgi:hypothetical protein